MFSFVLTSVIRLPLTDWGVERRSITSWSHLQSYVCLMKSGMWRRVVWHMAIEVSCRNVCLPASSNSNLAARFLLVTCLHWPQHGRSTFFRNVGELSLDSMTSHARRVCSSWSQLYEPQTLVLTLIQFSNTHSFKRNFRLWPVAMDSSRLYPGEGWGIQKLWLQT
jgi:hypothetical protein